MAVMLPIERAIQAAGGISALSRLLGFPFPSTVSNWRIAGEAPRDQCPAIERAINGAVRCEELCPSVTWLRDEAGAVSGYIVPVEPVEPKAA